MRQMLDAIETERKERKEEMNTLRKEMREMREMIQKSIEQSQREREKTQTALRKLTTSVEGTAEEMMKESDTDKQLRSLFQLLKEQGEKQTMATIIKSAFGSGLPDELLLRMKKHLQEMIEKDKFTYHCTMKVSYVTDNGVVFTLLSLAM